MKVQNGILVKVIPDCTVILCAHAPVPVLIRRASTLSLSSHLARDSGGVLCCVEESQPGTQARSRACQTNTDKERS